MTGTTLTAYLLLGATLLRALFVRGRTPPRTCARCGLRVERTRLGEAVCTCPGHDR